MTNDERRVAALLMVTLHRLGIYEYDKIKTFKLIRYWEKRYAKPRETRNVQWFDLDS